MTKWRKEGMIYKCDLFGTGYAQLPFIDPLNDEVWRVYYSSRTRDVISYPFYLDVEAGNPKNILKIYDRPILELGERGTFDDNGITLSSIIDVDGLKYLYYIGWNKKVSVSYALNIGLAVSDDGGDTFRKMFVGPILDRSIYDPLFTSAPSVLKDGDLYHMWYVSCLRWVIVDGRTEPVYSIKHAVSSDGVDWIRNNQICVDLLYEGEALARPWVIKENDLFKMWFSTRGSVGYRNPDGQHYMITYAESENGVDWVRKPDEFHLPLSESGWDSEMVEYCSIHVHRDTKYMLYNGNGFSRSGMGLALGEEE